MTNPSSDQIFRVQYRKWDRNSNEFKSKECGCHLWDPKWNRFKGSRDMTWCYVDWLRIHFVVQALGWAWRVNPRLGRLARINCKSEQSIPSCQSFADFTVARGSSVMANEKIRATFGRPTEKSIRFTFNLERDFCPRAVVICGLSSLGLRNCPIQLKRSRTARNFHQNGLYSLFLIRCVWWSGSSSIQRSRMINQRLLL